MTVLFKAGVVECLRADLSKVVFVGMVEFKIRAF